MASRPCGIVSSHCNCVFNDECDAVEVVYLSMHSLTGQWDSEQFIGLFGLLVYLSMCFLTGQWDRVQFIGLLGLFWKVQTHYKLQSYL